MQILRVAQSYISGNQPRLALGHLKSAKKQQQKTKKNFIVLDISRLMYRTYRSVNIRATVLLNLLNSLRKRDKMLGKSHILSLIPNLFNKFNKTRALM